ncbi:hypothetical protein O1611_g1966 [Lasiodiplodia mahajangana]|uniref:Uncharacterized protein n=1 Tax=Lasiodiplodia mahajangana TaxID=1108764 RepID=A0ACC2JVX1_9PEZI|nr:hypothetical protein O1611_g1966 [Lasiodiplodia mahajangana]
MTLTRIFTFAIADEAAQDFADGAPYIVATHAAKVKVLKDTTGGSAWTVYASITFKSEEDANYFAHEDPANQEVKAKNKEMTAGFCVIQGSFA